MNNNNNNTQLDDVYISPSFSSYSSDRLAQIADRVADNANSADDDFEFASLRENNEVSIGDFFNDGEIRRVFPVFNRDLLLNNDDDRDSIKPIPLSQLFIEDDRDHPPSCSSSEADELENIPEGTYCVWRPRTTESPQCKKSKSTGSASRRWSKLRDFRDLMRRSKSDGKDSFVFLTPARHKEEEEKSEKLGQTSRNAIGTGLPSAHEAFYVRNKAMKEGEKKKSYLPYRRELVGLFANVRVSRDVD